MGGPYGISLEEQQGDPNSLWNFYRKIIAIRKTNPVITDGVYKTLKNNKDDVFTFMRYAGNRKIVVAVNLSDKPETVSAATGGKAGAMKVLYGSSKPVTLNKDIEITMPAFGIEVIGGK